MGIGASRHWWKIGTWGKWALGNMSTMQGKQVFAVNGHLGTNNGHWGYSIGGKLAFGANGHQGKSAIGANGHFGANGYFGTDEHWGKWALRENGHQEKQAPEQMGFGQLG